MKEKGLDALLAAIRDEKGPEQVLEKVVDFLKGLEGVRSRDFDSQLVQALSDLYPDVKGALLSNPEVFGERSKELLGKVSSGKGIKDLFASAKQGVSLSPEDMEGGLKALSQLHDKAQFGAFLGLVGAIAALPSKEASRGPTIAAPVVQKSDTAKSAAQTPSGVHGAQPETSSITSHLARLLNEMQYSTYAVDLASIQSLLAQLPAHMRSMFPMSVFVREMEEKKERDSSNAAYLGELSSGAKEVQASVQFMERYQETGEAFGGANEAVVLLAGCVALGIDLSAQIVENEATIFLAGCVALGIDASVQVVERGFEQAMILAHGEPIDQGKNTVLHRVCKEGNVGALHKILDMERAGKLLLDFKKLNNRGEDIMQCARECENRELSQAMILLIGAAMASRGRSSLQAVGEHSAKVLAESHDHGQESGPSFPR